MASLSSATGTGHNPRGERRIARGLYIAIFVAVIVALGVFFFAGYHRQLNPYETDRPNATAPDVRGGAPGDRSGAVAEPQGNPPAPESSDTTTKPTEEQH
jgi:hypothetical protein